MAMSKQALAQSLEQRRQQLGMSCAVVARRARLGLSTVQRALADGDVSTTYETFERIAAALGATLRVQLQGPTVSQVKEQQAKQKARGLVAMTQGTSALEAAPLPNKVLTELEKQSTMQLLSGSPRRLWSR